MLGVPYKIQGGFSKDHIRFRVPLWAPDTLNPKP